MGFVRRCTSCVRAAVCLATCLGVIAVRVPLLAQTRTLQPQQTAGDPTPPRDQKAPGTPVPPAPPTYEETVDVVGVTPIHGLGVARDKIPANVQTASGAALGPLAGGHVGDVLARGFASVSLNEAQSNAYQPDMQFRGFTASPLLGLPQGLAVYQNGVRVNESFGDTVNWDVLPTNAIASINLMPGSNPLFGLNALGGALSIQTKTGFTHAGHAASASIGSFGRRWVDVESGGHGKTVSYFVAGRVLGEDGWRDFSESQLRQAFANVEWRGGATMLSASVTASANRLIGNGPAPVQLLEEARTAIFTHQDITETDTALVSLSGRHSGLRNVILDGVFFVRPVRVATVNGDDSFYGPCELESDRGFLCADEGDGARVVDQSGRFVALGLDSLDATSNTTSTRTTGWGGSLQATVLGRVAGRTNQFIVGGGIDAGRSRYESDAELGRFTETRGARGVGIFDAGAAVRLRSRATHASVFLSDFIDVSSRTTVMASARATSSRVVLRDQRGTALDGDHSFARLNPAVGITHEAARTATVFGGFSMSSRVPTPSELSCADPDAPCRLPNAFLADPPLRQVVARTFEGGARGRAGLVGWSASAFRTTSRDDIVFVSSGALTGLGHFENVGDTLRRGVELGVTAGTGSLRWGAAYTYLRATFETPLTLSSPNHPLAIDDEITVRPGADLPGTPRHNLKLTAAGAVGPAGVGVSVAAVSGQRLRGDEAGLLPPLDGFATVNLTGEYTLRRGVVLVARANNVFDARYETFGLLGDAEDVLGDDFDDPRFVGPGAPRAAWVGLTLSWR
jgi:hypothetical protein